MRATPLTFPIRSPVRQRKSCQMLWKEGTAQQGTLDEWRRVEYVVSRGVRPYRKEHDDLREVEKSVASMASVVQTCHFQLIVKALPVDIPRGHGMSR